MLTPERLLQFDVTLIFTDAGVSEQAGIQSSQLTAADDAALPRAEGGDSAEQPGRFVAGNTVGLEQGGTEGTFHGGHPSACGGAGVCFRWANYPERSDGSVVTAE